MPGARPSPAPFVGRQQERATLVAHLESAQSGEGGAVCLSGEPGIGKSRLLEELADHARQSGSLVLSGRAYDMEGMPPYLPFVEVLRGVLRWTSDEAFPGLTDGARTLRLLLPELGARIPEPKPGSSAGPDGERFQLFESVSALLTNIARKTEFNGLLVTLDDMHWADSATLLLLQHLAHKLHGTSLLIVAAYRPTDLDQDHPLNRVLADLTRQRLCAAVPVVSLTEGDTSSMIELATGTVPSSSFARELHRETSGNPFYIEEVIHHLLDSGADLSLLSGESKWDVPNSVRQVIQQRISRLAPGTKVVLQEAAVLGHLFDFDLLAAATGAGLEPLASAVEDAERAGMLRPEANGYAFAHCLVRRTIYDDLSIPRRRQAHQRAAEAMEASRHDAASAGQR